MALNKDNAIIKKDGVKVKIKKFQEADFYIRALINSLPDIAWLKDKEGKFIFVNEAFVRTCGLPLADIIGKSDVSIWPSRDIANTCINGDIEVIKTGKTIKTEEKLTDIEGKSQWVQIIKSPVFNRNGNIIGTTGVAKDITEVKLFKKILEKSREELDELIKERTFELNELNERLTGEIKDKEEAITNLQTIKEIQDIITTISTNFINILPDDLDNEINRVLKIIGLLSGADRSYIYEYQSEQHTIVKIFEWQRVGTKNSIHAPESINGDIINEFIYNLRNSDHVYISDKSKAINNKILYEGMEKYNVKSLLAVPIIYNNNFIGLLGFDTKNENKEWRNEIISLLRVIGNIFASVFERKYSDRKLKMLQENLRISYEKESEHLNRLRILNKVITISNNARSLEELYKGVVNTTLELLNFQIGCIYIADEGGQKLNLEYKQNIPKDIVENISIVNVIDYPFCDVFTYGKCIIRECTGNGVTNGIIPDIKSAAAVPLGSGNKIIGTLNVGTRENHHFTEQEKDILMSIGREVGTAIEKMIIEGKIKESLEEKKRLIDELNRKNEILNKLAITDGLTGLYNHKHILEILRKEYKSSRRKARNISILMLDIDYFKTINDSYGHQFGDEVLVIISNIIRRTIDDTDFAGRYGGEEFLIILIDKDEKEAYKTAEDIRRKIESYKWSHEGLKVTLSGGTAQLKNEKIKEWIKAADDRLYISKYMGRNRITTGINNL